MATEQHHPSPPSVRMRRMVRHWGVIFLISIGFLILAVCVREESKTVPVESIGMHHATGLAL